MVDDVAAVVIGRNEGERLVRCLASLKGQVLRIVYVDSGSTDGSVEAARAVNADVLELDLSAPFTAARARNAGFARAVELYPETAFVQFVDGDCEIEQNWVQQARSVLEADTELAIVFGHQRERNPNASVLNQLSNDEWANTPVGNAKACGGNALMRRTAFEQIGGYNDALIAGEEPEMCYRMRQSGWRIERIDVPMALHGGNMTKMSQWWQRCRRGGHTYAEGVAMYGSEPERYHVDKLRKTLFWGAGIPVLTVLACVFFGFWGLLLLLAWPLQVLRLSLKGMPLYRAFFMTLSKLPETQGALSYWLGRLIGRQRRTLIEYK